MFQITTPGPGPLRQLAGSALGAAASLTGSAGGIALLGGPQTVAAVWGDGQGADHFEEVWDCALSRSEAFRVEAPGRSALAAPVRIDGRLAGLFILARGDPEYSDQELAAVGKLAGLYALAAQWTEAQSELAMLRAVVDSMREAVAIIDVQRRFVFVNEAFRTLYGYSDEEMRGVPIEELLGREVDPALPDAVLTATCQGGWQGEVRGRKKDGTEFSVFLSTAPVANSEGDVTALVGVATDVTELKRAEAELRGLFAAMQDGVFVTDREGRFLKTAAGLPLLSGPVGRTIPEVLPPAAAGRLMSAIERMGTAGGLVSAEFSLPAGGEERWFEARVSSVHDHLLWVVRDMTEHRREEQRRRELEERLVQSQKLESLGRLAGGVAHDFNNLLTVINGYASLLLSRTPPGQAVEAGLTEIGKAGERAAELVRQLLAFGRRQVLQPRRVNVNDVIAGLEPMLKRLISATVELATRLDPALPTVFVDPHQLERAIVNLAANANDAMPAGGRLAIETARVAVGAPRPCRSGALTKGEYVKVSVSDTGTGMDETVRAHLFEPFFTTKEMGRGLGMGLSTVLGIVAQSGGHVDVSSVPGAGTTIDLYFRASAADDSAGGSSLP